MFAAAAMSTAAFSQISIDPEIGMNISNLRSKVGDNDAENNDSKVGFSAGAGVNIDLKNGLYVRPGVYYHLLGDKNEVADVTTTTNLHYIRIPVNIGYNYAIGEKAGSIFVEAGPYAGLALAGNTKVESPLGDEEYDINFGDEAAEMKSMDFGLNFGIGYETPWGIYVKGSYGLGLSTLSNIDDHKLTNNNFNVGIGYRIKL